MANNKNITDLYGVINEFMEGYQPRTKSLKDENVYLSVYSHSILNRWKNYYCQLWNAHGVNNITETEIYTAEPLVPELSSSEVEIAIENLRRYKSPDIYQIVVEMIQAGGNILLSEIHNLLFLFGIRKN
jgi:hypothetical protein